MNTPTDRRTAAINRLRALYEAKTARVAAYRVLASLCTCFDPEHDFIRFLKHSTLALKSRKRYRSSRTIQPWFVLTRCFNKIASEAIGVK